MTPSNDAYETPRVRTLWLGLGFVVLVAIGIATVVLPELADEPEETQSSSQDVAGASAEDDKPPSE